MFHSVADQHDVRRFIRHDLRPRWSGKLGTKPTEGENADDAQRLGFERIDSEGGASFTVPNRSFDELDQAFRVWREKIQKR